ncbi:class I SAM-dependent methyltransferase [Oerskovia paurometabola]|uniref:Class I SAM-dependent methyltransferase n=1 Tax=Oerskovia paurometabola TaxID=162170 RepID=A0ABW1X8L4_9CELL|nr:class I SAM-dependent methyltransferase [Oerskovia paurometabola]MBM7497677.1 SAM-dependent methyltransferase [Oerskovia paurometabola]
MSDPYWNHSTHYFPVLTRLVGPGTRTALDVGCGEGLLTRRLRAAGAGEVLGLDLDPAQVDRARLAAGGSPGQTGLDYVTGDVLDPLTGLAGPFDLVTTVATLHHLPLDAGLRRLRDLVAPGGTLAVVGLTRPRTAWDQPGAGQDLPAPPQGSPDDVAGSGSTARRSPRSPRATPSCVRQHGRSCPAPGCGAGSTGGTRSCGARPGAGEG